MYSFYIVKGHRLVDLENLSEIEKRFYIASMNEYFIERAILLGAKESDVRN